MKFASAFQSLKNFGGIARCQLAGVTGINPPFGFRRPSRFTRLLFRRGNRIPQHVNQPGAFRGGQSENFILNGGDAYDEKLQLFLGNANSIFYQMQFAFATPRLQFAAFLNDFRC